jgi:uncharacterized damage-inducible protein DinB
MTTTLVSMFDHMAWADARVIAMLNASPHVAEGTSVLRLLAHVVAAERVWLLRIHGQGDAAPPIWPEWTLAQIAATATDNATALNALVAHLTDDRTSRVIEYRNSQGVAFRSALGDILLQVALHGSYHRGQIAAALRANGVTPINTDYITYARERNAT